ncbi:hypothetical protein [Streptosporangium sp. 'caverna']|uniref:hypothetical protein n=1 Tax=Streptosporangium sp. 'caverna' TaxID=2202249 RepID=UPI00195515FD|nr:hypothetical protein [Streptosporangium sp. 'caverna']
MEIHTVTSGRRDEHTRSLSGRGPDLERLRAAVGEFAGYTAADRSWERLLLATGPRIDPALPAHRRALLAWLNAWGCRIRYPRDGEHDVFCAEADAWWARWGERLPGRDAVLAGLTDTEIDLLGDCYADLSAMPAAPGARPRSLGSTAATKMLHALRPRALMPWDAAIADALHGARTADAYRAHLRLGRRWARRLLAESDLGEEALAVELGRPGRPLAKMLDDYCYLEFTAGT